MATDTALTADAAPTAKRKRRWLQFSLRHVTYASFRANELAVASRLRAPCTLDVAAPAER